MRDLNCNTMVFLIRNYIIWDGYCYTHFYWQCRWLWLLYFLKIFEKINIIHYFNLNCIFNFLLDFFLFTGELLIHSGLNILYKIIYGNFYTYEKRLERFWNYMDWEWVRVFDGEMRYYYNLKGELGLSGDRTLFSKNKVLVDLAYLASIVLFWELLLSTRNSFSSLLGSLDI